MGKGIVKIGDLYCEWSTVVDAPVSNLFPFDAACTRWTQERVERAKERGHSFNDYRPNKFFWIVNRAGPNEENLTLEGLLYLAASNPAEEWPKPLPESWYIKRVPDDAFDKALIDYRASMEAATQ